MLFLKHHFSAEAEFCSIFSSGKILFIMLGLGDGCVLAAMIGTVAITLVCVVFGALNWNKGTEDDKK